MYSESMEISLVIISPLFGNKEEKQLLFLLRKYFGEGNVFYCKWSLLWSFKKNQPYSPPKKKPQHTNNQNQIPPQPKTNQPPLPQKKPQKNQFSIFC